MQKLNARCIAFYLPQYHPIPENDEWWGKGFTEWRNVAKARPLFRGHHQPNLPGELGFYDLRVPEVREAQATLAKEHGIEGFCYWHYWLGNGRRLLQRPFQEVVDSGTPDFPFCLAWANHPWTGVWFGSKEVLAEQTYPGLEDYQRHFDYLLTALTDKRYITVDGKPLIYIYRPHDLPDPNELCNLWRNAAQLAGLKGLHIVAEGIPAARCKLLGFDAYSYSNHRLIGFRKSHQSLVRRLRDKILGRGKSPEVYTYEEAMSLFLRPGISPLNEYPSIVPNWDSTPRLGRNGVVLHKSTPELFRIHVREALAKVEHKPAQQRILFAKSWNEWAEGNYLEPDLRFGRRYLEVLHEELQHARLHAPVDDPQAKRQNSFSQPL
jgi:hypothetical protein